MANKWKSELQKTTVGFNSTRTIEKNETVNCIFDLQNC